MSDNDLRKVFSENLKRLLLERDKTQADLSRYMHVSTATAANWCNGKIMPRIDKIQSICNWFCIEKSDLLDSQNKENSYYINEDARELAEFLHKSPEYKVLFDASRKVKPEDIDKVKQMIDIMRGNSTNDPA